MTHFDRKQLSFDTKESSLESKDLETDECFDTKENAQGEPFDADAQPLDSKDTPFDRKDGRKKPRTRKQILAYQKNFKQKGDTLKMVYALEKRLEALEHKVEEMRGDTRNRERTLFDKVW